MKQNSTVFSPLTKMFTFCSHDIIRCYSLDESEPKKKIKVKLQIWVCLLLCLLIPELWNERLKMTAGWGRCGVTLCASRCLGSRVNVWGDEGGAHTAYWPVCTWGGVLLLFNTQVYADTFYLCWTRFDTFLAICDWAGGCIRCVCLC